jgi:twitching motility two-component system response regulator PilG
MNTASQINWSDKKILVIDDSMTIRRGAEIFLQPTHAQLFFAVDGVDGLVKAAEVLPDLVFCDLLMPRADGYQTCAAIKQNPKSAHTPVVLLTGKEGDFDRAQGVLVGADHYMTKPFSAEDLIRVCTFFFNQTN